MTPATTGPAVAAVPVTSTAPALTTSPPADDPAGISTELRALAATGLERRLRPLGGPAGARITLAGREVLCLCSNNYLGLAAHSSLRAAATAALAAEGTGTTSARLIAGNFHGHRELEARVAAFHGTPASLLYGSGYHANVGVLSALAHAGDVIYSDALNHASIVDGCRLSRARVRIIPHADAQALRDALRQERAPCRRRVVVTESLFSMDGDLAPLADLASVCREAGALLVVDEAHAVGAAGPGGRGLAAAVGVQPDVLVGTFSKAFGSFGGYVVASAALVELLRNRSRSFIFSTALPPPVVAASLAALEVAASFEGDTLRDRLQANSAFLAAGLARLATGPRPTRHIQPFVVGAPDRATVLCEALLNREVFVQGIRPPTVPAGSSRLRFSVSASHTTAHLEVALSALAAALTQLPSP
jgi:8-amino-7-oxononanoate synthase